MIDRLVATKSRVVPDTEGCLVHLIASVAAVALSVALAAMLVIPVQAQQTDRAKELGKKLFCACGCTQVLTACNHVGCTTSTAMLKELDSRIARGDSDDLILQSFVQEYGLKVLTEPPNKGFNRFAVIAPIVAPLASLLILWEVVRRWRKRATLVGAGAFAGGPPISPELLARARSESRQGTYGESDE
jgi:cytochrome c-type biogenesis protein CcmH/NrfF